MSDRRKVLAGICGLAGSTLCGCLGSVLRPDEGEYGGPGSDESTLRWSATLGDELRSPVVADSGTTFVSARDEHLYAVDARSGERRWRVNVGLPGYPLIHEETAYTRSIRLTVSAIDTRQGTVKWRELQIRTNGARRARVRRWCQFYSLPGCSHHRPTNGSGVQCGRHSASAGVASVIRGRWGGCGDGNGSSDDR